MDVDININSKLNLTFNKNKMNVVSIILHSYYTLKNIEFVLGCILCFYVNNGIYGNDILLDNFKTELLVTQCRWLVSILIVI